MGKYDDSGRYSVTMGIFTKDTDQDWKRIGNSDPYFGVLTSEVYKNSSLTEEARQQFFLSGEKYAQEVVKNIQEKIVLNFHPREALDFGCGVGRILIPLSKYCDKIYGIDVSDGMRKKYQAEYSFFPKRTALLVDVCHQQFSVVNKT